MSARLGALLLVLLPATAVAQSWPVWRHDAGRSGRNPQPALLEHPAELFAAPLGAALGRDELLVDDVDLDELPDTVFARSGRLLALRRDGTLDWASADLHAGRPYGTADFDGSGRPGVACATALPGLAIVDGTAGRTLFSTAAGAILSPGTVLPLDADGDGAVELYVADDGCANGGVGAGRVYSFAGGAATTTTLRTETHGTWCGRGHVLADLDGDGRPEIVAPSDDRIWAYDPVGGFSAFASPSLDTFPWGLVHLAAADLDGDGADELILASSNDYRWLPSARRLQVLSAADGDLVSRWRVLVDPAAGAQRFLDAPAADVVAGSPGLEVVSSIADSASAGWQVRVYRGLPDGPAPQVLAAIPAAVALGLADLTGDGTSEILARDAPQLALDDAAATLTAWQVHDDGTVAALWTVPAAWLPLAPAPDASRSVLRPAGRDGWGAPDGPLVRRGPGGLSVVVVERDADDDGIPDTLALLDGPTGVEREHWSSPGLASGTAAGISAVVRAAGGTAWLAAALDDGRVAQLGPDLAPVDDADGDGVPDVFAADRAHSPPLVDDAGGALLTDFAGRIGSLSGAPGAPAAAPAFWASFRFPRGVDTSIAAARGSSADDTPIDVTVGPARTTDGQAAVGVVDAATPPLQTLGVGRAAGWSYDALPAGTLDPAAPGWDAVALALYDGSTGRSALALVSPGAHRSLWTGLDADGAVGGPLSAADLDGDGIPELLDARTGCVQAVSATGTEVLHRDTAGGGAILALDIDGDGRPELFRTGADSFAIERLDRGLERVWIAGAGESHRGRYAAAARGGDGSWRLGAVPENSAELAAYAADDGSVLWRVALAGGRAFATTADAHAAGATPGVLSSPIAAAAPAGSGSDVLVAGSTDGRLYGVVADDGSLAWSVALHAAVGEPSLGFRGVAAQPQLFAPAADGLVHVIGSATLAAPAAVWDGDGSTDPASEADDIDVSHDAGVVAAAWPAVDGAAAYFVQLVTGDDVVVRPWVRVAEPRFVARDAALRPHGWYRVLVRAAAGAEVSPETASDGFEVLDDDVPWVDVVARPPRIRPDIDGIDDASVIDASLSDAVMLLRWRAEVQDGSGNAVRTLGGAETGRARLAAGVTWDGRGDDGRVVAGGPWRVVFFAVDSAEHEGRGETTVWVCAGDALADPACAPEAADAGGEVADGARDAVDAGDGGLPFVPGGAGGCACRGAGGPASPGVCGIAALVAALVVARRRGRRKDRNA